MMGRWLWIHRLLPIGDYHRALIRIIWENPAFLDALENMLEN